MISYDYSNDTFTLTYDSENRLIEVKKNSVSMATFVYDGDGNRVKSTVNGTVTTFVGGYYEVTGSQVTKYYFAGSQRIAMRKYTIPQPMTVEYFLGDHLGSTSITTDNTGAKVSEMRYKPWGETRYTWTAALSTTPAYALTKYTFTGQYSYTGDFGLMFYNARWYDSLTGRFVQADSIVPGGIQGLDRYSYVFNNPLSYVDPSGHCGIKYNDRGQPTVGDLDCTAKDIDKWSIEYRQQWFDLLTEKYGGWFNNIEGILQAFNDTNTQMGGTWASVTDAGILETIQNGIATTDYGVSLDSFGEQGSLRRDASEKWAAFFSSYGKESDATLKTLWGDAEVAGTTYGRDLAETGLGLSPSESEENFLRIGDAYRSVMGITYGGELLGLDIGYLGCGAGCAMTGWQVGGWATDPRSQVPGLGQAPVYWMAIIVLGQ